MKTTLLFRGVLFRGLVLAGSAVLSDGCAPRPAVVSPKAPVAAAAPVYVPPAPMVLTPAPAHRVPGDGVGIVDIDGDPCGGISANCHVRGEIVNGEAWPPAKVPYVAPPPPTIAEQIAEVDEERAGVARDYERLRIEANAAVGDPVAMTHVIHEQDALWEKNEQLRVRRIDLMRQQDSQQSQSQPQ